MTDDKYIDITITRTLPKVVGGIPREDTAFSEFTRVYYGFEKKVRQEIPAFTIRIKIKPSYFTEHFILNSSTETPPLSYLISDTGVQPLDKDTPALKNESPNKTQPHILLVAPDYVEVNGVYSEIATGYYDYIQNYHSDEFVITGAAIELRVEKVFLRWFGWDGDLFYYDITEEFTKQYSNLVIT